MAKEYSKELLDLGFDVEVLDGTKPERTFFAITADDLQNVFHVEPTDSVETARKKIMEVTSKDEFLYDFFNKDPMVWEIKGIDTGYWMVPVKEEKILGPDEIMDYGYDEDHLKKMRFPIKTTEVKQTYQQKFAIRFTKRKPVNAITDDYFFNLYERAFEDFLAHDNAYTAILQNHLAVQPPKKNKSKYNFNKFVVIPDIELHLGKLGNLWDSSDPYDYKRALYRYVRLILEAEQVVKLHHAGEVLMTVGNDFFNTDTEQNTTTAGTEQHNDTRFQQMISSGVAAHIWAIERMKQNCDVLHLVFQPGNHDYLTSYMLFEQLHDRYKDDPKVDISGKIKDLRGANAFLWRTTLMIFDHGKGPDGKAKNDKKLSLLPYECFRALAKVAEHIVVHAGHYHNASERYFAENGVMVVRNGSSSGSSAWDAQNMYESDKTAQAYVYDAEKGLETIVNLSLTKEELGKGISIPPINDETEYSKTISKCISSKADDIVLEELRKLVAANEKEIKSIDKKYEKIFKKLESILDNPDISPEKKKEIIAAVGYEDEIKPFIAKRQTLQENIYKREHAIKLTRRAS